MEPHATVSSVRSAASFDDCLLASTEGGEEGVHSHLRSRLMGATEEPALFRKNPGQPVLASPRETWGDLGRVTLGVLPGRKAVPQAGQAGPLERCSAFSSYSPSVGHKPL